MSISARHYARLGAVQYLYTWEAQQESGGNVDEPTMIDSNVLVQGDLHYLQKLLTSIPPRIPEIDSILASVINRNIQSVDRVGLAILRLGTYELIADPDIPPKVVVDECIQLSREFGNPDSYRFINGTLHNLAFNDKSFLMSTSPTSKSKKSDREFSLIKRYFKQNESDVDGLTLGIGDDCAVVDIPPGKQLLISTDTFSEGVHFPAGTDAESIGFKSLAASLSDLAAMGAFPAFATLNLSIPKYDDRWLKDFSNGFFKLAKEYRVNLIGGDTTAGPLNVGVTVYGLANSAEWVPRTGAQPGDYVCVTGNLGDAALGLVNRRLGLQISSLEANHLKQKLERPKPQITAGQIIRKFASAVIDISDGLIADLSHILEASGVSATIELEKIPISNTYRKLLSTVGWDYALSHGDDYELCFTVPADRLKEVASDLSKQRIHCSQVGTIKEGKGLRVLHSTGKDYEIKRKGFTHF